MAIWDTTSDFGVNYGSVPAPAFDWTKITPKTDWYQAPDVDWGGQFDLPGLQGTGALSSRPSGTDWLGTLGKGLEALSKARSYQASQSASGSDSYDKYLRAGAGNASLVGQGRNYRMYQQQPKQRTTQSGGSSGMGGAIGTLAGIGASFIPGLGPGIAAAMPAIGGSLGSMFR